MEKHSQRDGATFENIHPNHSWMGQPLKTLSQPTQNFDNSESDRNGMGQPFKRT
jgi:hypothetical protein